MTTEIQRGAHHGMKAIVTGANSGIGLATAQRLLNEGAKVLMVDLAEEASIKHPAASYLQADVAGEKAHEHIAASAKGHLGGIDFLINNAGMVGGGPVESMKFADWGRILDVNLSAVFRLCQASIPSLKQSTRGRIVNIGSIMTTLAGVGMGAYTTSKHAVAGLTKTLALELGEFGITANFIQPGAIITGITQASLDAGPEFERFWSEKSALGRLGRPEDIAAAAPDGPRFFQLQPCRSRQVMDDMIQLAASSGYDALILTVDNPIHGNRERDARSGFGVPSNFTLKAWLSILSRPRWMINTFPLPGFGLYDQYMNSPDRDLAWLAHQLITNINWEDLAWIRSRWDGPFAIKGLVAVDDIKTAVECGVSAVIVSNQGARHFDTAPATLDMLPAVVDAVGDRVEVILDGGIRRGTDVLKAIALGAKACTGARPYCYGLAGAGRAGAEHALALLRAEVERTMVFLGAASLDEVGARHIMLRPLARGDDPDAA